LVLGDWRNRSCQSYAGPRIRAVAVLTGIASVKDGDGLQFGSVEIRLQGIAAPELDDKLGRESKGTWYLWQAANK